MVDQKSSDKFPARETSLRHLGPAPTLWGGYPEPASLAPAPPPTGYPAKLGAARRAVGVDLKHFECPSPRRRPIAG